MTDYKGLEPQQLLKFWDTVSDPVERDKILEVLQSPGVNLFPSEKVNYWEKEAGLYPDIDDPNFTEKLMKKQEYIENMQDSLKEAQRRGENMCDTERDFELTSVQRFISRFLSPQSPYQSALLYHGVGVGKTCAAITTAEEYLLLNPKDSVFIVAPRNIQPGFRRTIFDEETLVIPKDRAIANSANGCTGDLYIKRTGTEYESDKGLIMRKINQSINSRYKIYGYIQFGRYIQDILNSVQKTANPLRYKQEKIKALRRAFDGKLVIIDEAHNLRDAPGETEDDNLDSPDVENDISESKAGKRLTPVLLQMLSDVRGMKLMLLSGTPMYNHHREIIFLLNLLLRNDKKAEISEKDIFDASGKFTKNGKQILGKVASAYLSFMRGENPLTFPVRLHPRDAPVMEEWPTEDPQGKELPMEPEAMEMRKKTLMNLPFVPLSYEGEELKLVKAIANSVIERSGGLGLQSIDEMVQSGNWLFPGDSDTDLGARIRDTGFENVFSEKKTGVTLQYESREDVSWLVKGELKRASPKADFIVNRISTAKGVVFIYSRFIKSGALPMAIALEANGYTPWGTNKPLLTNPNLGALGRQCALCENREKAHAGKAHPFTPAKYVLLTGQVGYSPNNAASIKAARAKENMYGKEVKVVIGSQVASEGIDLRFIREIYVFDSWFHLNKMEQVLGRGVRTCSHSLLKAIERNCTIYLLVNTYGNEPVETADMYMYRTAMNKAVTIGRVTRVLKQYALDCNLNISVNLVNDLEGLTKLEDSQGKIRGVDDEDPKFRGKININDTPYTSICDWMECPFTCAKPVDLKGIMEKNEIDMSTYDEYAMRWRESQIKEIMKHIFESEQQPNIQMDTLSDAFREAGIPDIAIRILLGNVVNNKSFRLFVKGQEGYITYSNGYYLFQPIRLVDVRIPLALRIADVPIGRDSYIPTKYKYVTAEPGAKPDDKLGAKPGDKPDDKVGDKLGAKLNEPVLKEAVEPPVNTAELYWKQCIDWAKQMKSGESPLDIPPEIVEVLNKRYTGESYKREFNVLSMISWMHDNIRNSLEIPSDEDRVRYRAVLADVFLEIIWDESIKPSEQISMFFNPENKSDELTRTVLEQEIIKDGTSAFRYVNPLTGQIEYMCGRERCSQAVINIFETDKTDPINVLEANRETTSLIYGFIIPKIKEGKFVLKTNDRPVNKGKPPEKGKECENVSTIDGHKEQLREIRTIITALGYPQFLLSDTILNEKEGRAQEATKMPKKKKEDDGLSPIEHEKRKMREKLMKDIRKFQNVVKACALKNIILRMVDKMERQKNRLRYFYRPIAAIKTKHKLK